MPAILRSKAKAKEEAPVYRQFLCEVCTQFTPQSVTLSKDETRLIWTCQRCNTLFVCIRTPYGWIPKALLSNPLRMVIMLRNVRDIALKVWRWKVRARARAK